MIYTLCRFQYCLLTNIVFLFQDVAATNLYFIQREEVQVCIMYLAAEGIKRIMPMYSCNFSVRDSLWTWHVYHPEVEYVLYLVNNSYGMFPLFLMPPWPPYISLYYSCHIQFPVWAMLLTFLQWPSFTLVHCSKKSRIQGLVNLFHFS